MQGGTAPRGFDEPKRRGAPRGPPRPPTRVGAGAPRRRVTPATCETGPSRLGSGPGIRWYPYLSTPHALLAGDTPTGPPPATPFSPESLQTSYASGQELTGVGRPWYAGGRGPYLDGDAWGSGVRDDPGGGRGRRGCRGARRPRNAALEVGTRRGRFSGRLARDPRQN